MKAIVMSETLLAGLFLLAGCDPKNAQTGTPDKKKEVDKEKEGDGHDWWCDEHGVKEADCSMCSAKVAMAFQAKGDWCKEHSRAKSQCFICDPKLKAKFAADYVAKFGKQPPEPEGQEPDKK